jgi:hypothetical protein
VHAQALFVLSLSIRTLSPSPRNSILNDPCESFVLNVSSQSRPSVNCVVVVVRKTIGPFGFFVFPGDIFEGIEYDNERLVGCASSELTPRPTRTIISENCAEE